jgi:hypothetical protein
MKARVPPTIDDTHAAFTRLTGLVKNAILSL